jgi:hypothetical protein
MQGRHRRNAGPIGNEFRRMRKRSAKKQSPRPHPKERKNMTPLTTAAYRPRVESPVERVATRVARKDETESFARGPMHCAFGAVRVGALLGRVRLHLQTDRFLAVHRGDALWEEGCREAALALAEIVSRMAEGEMDAALASCAPDAGLDRSEP